MTSPVDISVVVPCYNSGPWLADLVRRIDEALAEVAGTHEIVLVNDASPDRTTWAEIARLATELTHVHGIDLMRNHGQFVALLCGFEASSGRLIVTIDDDLQNPPEEIPKLLRAAEDDPDVDAVIGSYEIKQHSRLRNLGTKVVGTIYARAYGKPKDLQTTSFRVLRRPLVEAILAHQTARPVMGALILGATRRIINVPVAHHPRDRGTSGYRLGRLITATIDNVVAVTTAPLRFISALGMMTAAGALLLTLYYLVRAVTGSIGVAGFPTVVLLVTFLGGVNLVAVGVVGEYVVRVVAETTGAPRYVVRSRID